MKSPVLVCLILFLPALAWAQDPVPPQSANLACVNYQEEQLQKMSEKELIDTIAANDTTAYGIIRELRRYNQTNDAENAKLMSAEYNNCMKYKHNIMRIKNEQSKPQEPPKKR